MHMLSRLLLRFTGRREDASGSAEAAPAVRPSENPVVQAFLGDRVQEGRGLGAARSAVLPRAQANPLLGERDEDEARRIQERWSQQGAYLVSNTGKHRLTRKYFWWRQRLEALLLIPPRNLKEKVDVWRRWLGEFEAQALWNLRKQGEVPRAPGAIPLELADQIIDGEPLGPPPLTVYRFVLLYTVKLPENTQYAFRDDPVQLEDRYLVQENGVLKVGSRICGRVDLDELFTSAGINDATERKVIRKVSEVHGGFETINTCDTGFVSAGFVPFTSGEAGEGSLAQLLRSMKAASPMEFDECFRSLGIDVDARALWVVHPGSGQLLRGSEAVSAIIEDKRLTALFYNAGKKSRAYQVAQLKLARELYYLPLHDFMLKTLAKVGDKAVLISICGRYGDVLRSEAGKVAIMDRAVQRGTSNARQTFKEACLTVIEEKGLRTLDSLSLYEALITPVLQSPGKERVRVLEDKELSRPVEPPLP